MNEPKSWWEINETEQRKETKMNDHEKLEYIHSYLQEVQNGNADCGMLPHAIEFTEDIRETHPQAPWIRADVLTRLEHIRRLELEAKFKETSGEG